MAAPEPSVADAVRRASAQVEHVRQQAIRLESEVDEAVGGSATDVDGQLKTTLRLAATSAGKALELLHQLARAR